MTRSITAPAVPFDQAMHDLREHGHALVSAPAWCAAFGVDPRTLPTLASAWDRLPPDAWLRDGGRYRRRRHACYWADGRCTVDGGRLEAVPHRPHWQPVAYNALHGGLERWFEPVEPEVEAHPAWVPLLTGIASCATALCGRPDGEGRWAVEAHPFRIDTTDGIGRPTPEGAHRDGVDLVAVMLVARVGVKGGETRVFDADGPAGLRFTLVEPWTLLLVDDVRVIHETTPIQPLDPAVGGHRDTLVVTCRAGGFQGPPDGR